jgi:hypothetical protein
MTESCATCRFSRRRTIAKEEWLMCCRRAPAALNTAQTIIPELLQALALVTGRREVLRGDEDLLSSDVLSVVNFEQSITMANWPVVEESDWCGAFERVEQQLNDAAAPA